VADLGVGLPTSGPPRPTLVQRLSLAPAAVASPSVLRPKLVSMQHRILARLHNPRGYTCACLSSCWCHRTRFGEAFRWYVPARFHRLPDPV
jgi:hypothetical protein